MVDIYMLPAEQGDFIWIHYGIDKDMHNIIIDGGTTLVAADVRDTFEHIFELDEEIDAIFLTHIDNDHIGGLLNGMMLVDPSALQEKVHSIYMNTGRPHLKLIPSG